MKFGAIKPTGLKSSLFYHQDYNLYFSLRRSLRKYFTVFKPQEKLKCGKYCLAGGFCSSLLVTSIN